MPRPLARLAAAALALALVGSAADARPRRSEGYATSGPVVDVSRLRALGLGPTADLVQATITRELAVAPPALGRAVVRITGISINAYVGSLSGGGGGRGISGGNAQFDYLEGDFQVVAPNGTVMAERHQVVTSPSSSGGAYYLPDVDRRRIEAVSRNFAGWVRRYGS